MNKTCKYCGKRIPDHVKECPFCLKKQVPLGHKVLLGIALVILVGMVLSILIR